MLTPKTIVARYSKNPDGRDFVCGDIHGCYDDLEHYLRKFSFDPQRDRLFCVGDLFDRGPRSHDALEYLKKPWFHPVMGNHEHMFFEQYTLYKSLYKNYSYHNGSEWQRRETYSFIAKLAQAVEKLPLIIKLDDTLILHAMLPEVTSLEEIEQDPETYIDTIIWYRGPTGTIQIPGIKRVYCGHTPIKEPEDCNGFINIDTGAFIRYQGTEGKLTMIELSPSP